MGVKNNIFSMGASPTSPPLQVIVVKGYRRRRGGSLNKFTSTCAGRQRRKIVLVRVDHQFQPVGTSSFVKIDVR